MSRGLNYIGVIEGKFFLFNKILFLVYVDKKSYKNIKVKDKIN